MMMGQAQKSQERVNKYRNWAHATPVGSYNEPLPSPELSKAELDTLVAMVKCRPPEVAKVQIDNLTIDQQAAVKAQLTDEDLTHVEFSPGR